MHSPTTLSRDAAAALRAAGAPIRVANPDVLAAKP